MKHALLKGIVLAGLGLSLSVSLAAAQTFPDKPVHMIVPYAPGGQFDIHARQIANKMKDTLGQTVIIENKPGAATAIGATYVAQSKPDGYTILFAGANAFAVNPHQIKDLSYKITDFQPITLVSLLPQVFVINKNLAPVKTFAEFVAFMKQHPGKYSYGTSGTGGAQHLIGEQIKRATGIEMTQVGYRGTPEVLQELVAGQIIATVDGLIAYQPKAGPDGPLRILAINSTKRLSAIPDVPSFEELGYPQLTSGSWGALFAPAGTPRPVIDTLRKAIITANESPEIRDFVIKGGAEPVTSTPEELQAIIKADYEKWGEWVRQLNVH